MKLSIVVPTRNEVENIGPLLAGIERATRGLPTEVIFVDDSSDRTPVRIQELSHQFSFDVSLVTRPPGRRHGGLGGAVVEGCRTARGHWVCVMDADLQHPPELIPRLLARAEETAADIVLGSRLAKGGSTYGLGLRRSVVSRVLAITTRALFPVRLQGVSDPMTGFFLVRRSGIDLDRLRPDGFKILLEILVRCPTLRVSELPFRFGRRQAGRSKTSLREGVRLLRLLLRLADRHFPRFLVVGESGFIINNLILAILKELAGLHYLVSAVMATQGSTLWNFGLTETWVFPDRGHDRSRLQRLAMFFVLNNAALVLRGPILYVLTGLLGLHYLTSNMISLLTLTVLRYALAGRWIWPTARRARRMLDSYAPEARNPT
jgi:dolichol-phosphate mannosyltransferase